MISMKTIYQFSFYILIYVVFIVGGMLQFFIGIPNTIMTLGLSALMMINYIIYVVVKKKVVFNKVILWVFFYLLIIFLSGLINKTHIVNLSVYFIFPLLPLSMYLFFFINKKEHYINFSHRAYTTSNSTYSEKFI